jgi:hypothetical protein
MDENQTSIPRIILIGRWTWENLGPLIGFIGFEGAILLVLYLRLGLIPLCFAGLFSYIFAYAIWGGKDQPGIYGLYSLD